jgi:hypothetical protein
MLPVGSETAAPRRPELRFCRECNDLMKPKVGPCAVCRQVPVAAVAHSLDRTLTLCHGMCASMEVLHTHCRRTGSTRSWW